MKTAQDQLVELQDTLYTSKNPTRRWLHCIRRDWILDSISKFSNKTAGHALEIGPGSGIYLPALARNFHTVTATDIEAGYLNNIEKLKSAHTNLSLLIDDITHTALQNNSFDFILCTEVIEHIPNSLAALRNIQKLLKPGGVIVLSTPQKYSPLEITAKIAFLPGIIQMVRMIYNEPIIETGHINLLTAAQVRRQLLGSGFSIIDEHKSGVYLPLLAEFGGASTLKLAKWLERKLRGSYFDWILWTQFYIAKVD